jgi:hypothetical protein
VSAPRLIITLVLQFSACKERPIKSTGLARDAVFLVSMLLRTRSSLGLVLLVSTFSVPTFAGEFSRSNLAPMADESDSAPDFEVGARLVATTDVKLRDVSLAKGSRVVVRGVEVKRGRAASFDVELADGHVLKHIDAGTVRKAFAAAND